MKKALFLILFFNVAISLLVSCKDEDSIIGKIGPGGGIIFYDCDADNNEKNDGAGPDGLKSDVCGWRYLEAAPADLDSQYSYTDAISQCEAYSTKVGATVYDDWRLPTAYELNLLYTNLVQNGKGSFKDFQYYWSSDTSKTDPEIKAQAIKFKVGYEAASLSKLTQSILCYVRPIRAYR